MSKDIDIHEASVDGNSLGKSLVFSKVGLGSLNIIRHIVCNNESNGHRTIVISDDSSSYSGNQPGSCIQYTFLDFADNLYSWGRNCGYLLDDQKLEFQAKIEQDDRVIIRISYDVVENLDFLPAFISCLREKIKEHYQIEDENILFWFDDCYCPKEVMKYNPDLSFFQAKRKDAMNVTFDKLKGKKHVNV